MKKPYLLLGTLLVAAAAVLPMLSRDSERDVSGSAMAKDAPCVVLDAGHGGNDPGKVGINGAQEK